MFPEAGRATVALLEGLGHEVVFPVEQTCCGQMHVNSGYQDEAARLAHRFIEVFGDYELVVSPSSSCVGTVRELYPQMLGVSHGVLERVFELSELLVQQLGIDDVGASFPHRVTYHPTSHSLRLTHVSAAPLRLLRQLRGASSRTSRCAPISATRRTRFATRERQRSQSCPTGRSCAKPAARSRPTCSRGSTTTCSSSRAGSRRRARRSTGRATQSR